MLILLPPSEGKTRPDSGPALDLDSLSFQRLTPVRAQLLRALVKLCQGNPQRAMDVLRLGSTQAESVLVNAALLEQPAARADAIYTGVLFSALDLPSLDEATRMRADESLAITSALFGLLRPDDAIPAYRLSGTVTLPRLGTVAGRWRTPLPRVLRERAAGGLLVDLRSGAYAALGRPPVELASRTATMRVLHERGGARTVVSHFNKATKGRIARGLLEADVDPTSVEQLQSVLTDLGWTVERTGQRLDIVVAEV